MSKRFVGARISHVQSADMRREERDRERFKNRRRTGDPKHVPSSYDMALGNTGKMNATVDAIRRLRGMWSTVKQPGRRYGPPPLSGNDRSTPPARMTIGWRRRCYFAQNGARRLTPRQLRQIGRMQGLDARDEVLR